MLNTQVVPTTPQFAAIELSTGARLHYAAYGNPGGEAVIFLPGYSDSWFSYSGVAPLLQLANHRLFVLDQRGHGNSSKGACCYTANDFAGDVIAFLDAKGIRQATIVGHSMGSMIAQLVAIHHLHRVARLVLIGSMVTGGNEEVQGLNQVVQTLTDPVDPEFVRGFQLSTIYDNVASTFVERAIAESLKMPAHVWRQAMASFVEQNTIDDLPRITAPTLIVWGEQDQVFPRTDQEILAERIANATLLVYEETGHAVHWEQTERFAADLQRFLMEVH